MSEGMKFCLNAVVVALALFSPASQADEPKQPDPCAQFSLHGVYVPSNTIGSGQGYRYLIQPLSSLDIIGGVGPSNLYRGVLTFSEDTPKCTTGYLPEDTIQGPNGKHYQMALDKDKKLLTYTYFFLVSNTYSNSCELHFLQNEISDIRSYGLYALEPVAYRLSKQEYTTTTVSTNSAGEQIINRQEDLMLFAERLFSSGATKSKESGHIPLFPLYRFEDWSKPVKWEGPKVCGREEKKSE